MCYCVAAVASADRLGAAFVRGTLPGFQQPVVCRASLQTQVESILAKPNYRHQKKQKEQARKLRQAEKQSRRLAARAEADGAAAPGGLAAVQPDSATSAEGTAPVRAET